MAERRTNRIGQQVIHLPQVTSTNDYAFQLARNGAADGCVIRADEQTDGKGRRGRRWHSEKGYGLWLSLILRPDLPTHEAGLIPFFASLAVHQAIETYFKISADLKWPNDLLIQHKKICGILSEVDIRHSKLNFIILGIGINLKQKLTDFPQELRDIAGSIGMFTKQNIEINAFFAQLLSDLNFYYSKLQQYGFKPILEDWKSKCRFLKQVVTLKSGSENLIGIFEDLLPDGAMLFRQNGETIKLTSAELDYQK